MGNILERQHSKLSSTTKSADTIKMEMDLKSIPAMITTTTTTKSNTKRSMNHDSNRTDNNMNMKQLILNSNEHHQYERQAVEKFQKEIDNGETVWKVLISDPDLAKMQKFVETLPLDQVSPEWSWVDRADITAVGNSKGKMLVKLLEREGIDPARVVAFGDNFNDISMLQQVGLGIAMGGSEEEVQRKADKTIGLNSEDSIAEELTQLFQL